MAASIQMSNLKCHILLYEMHAFRVVLVMVVDRAGKI